MTSPKADDVIDFGLEMLQTRSVTSSRKRDIKLVALTNLITNRDVDRNRQRQTDRDRHGEREIERQNKKLVEELGNLLAFKILLMMKKNIRKLFEEPQE